MLSTVLFVSTALAQVAAGPDPVACIKTTIGATGQTSKSEIVTTSGNKAQDRGALRFLKALDFPDFLLALSWTKLDTSSFALQDLTRTP